MKISNFGKFKPEQRPIPGLLLVTMTGLLTILGPNEQRLAPPAG
jgi:hypothetical protein